MGERGGNQESDHRSRATRNHTTTTPSEIDMNRDIVQGNWKQFKGKVRVRWGRLVGDYLGVVTGRRTQLVGERQRAFGVFRSKH
jgi:uncharacterized protein YjbJ (UPF0337 family)